MKILTILGTRPEAIKLASVIKQIENTEGVSSRVCSTGQHRSMLDQVRDFFGLEFHYDLNLMSNNQRLSDLTSKLFHELPKIIKKENPDLVLVQGDTATTFVASITSFQAGISVGHIEAGLRSGNINSPWPEEANRKLTSVVSKYHFAPTKNSKNNLVAEGFDEQSIVVTGNTVIDSLLFAGKKINKDKKLEKSLKQKFDYLLNFHQLVLVTVHRRESFGEPIYNIARGLSRAAKINKKTAFVIPVHLNPNVSEPLNKVLKEYQNVFLLPPLDYPAFVFLMNQCTFLVTDSGGLQEEAPALNKPVLVLRDVTERIEAVDAGCVELIGTNEVVVFKKIHALLGDKGKQARMAFAKNPYGDGSASKTIVDHILKTEV